MSADELDEAAVAAAWERNAAQWTQDVRAGYDRYRELYTRPAFLDFLPNLAGLEAIDLGCGEGSNTRLLAERGGRMTGVDITQSFIDTARRREAEEPLGIRYETASFTDLTGFEDASFDLAVSTMALMDGPDFAGAMRAAFRVLRPGGRLAFSILHPCFITPATAWVRDAAGEPLGLRVGRYFERAPFVERWHFSKRPPGEAVEPFEVPRFPRTLSDYLNGMTEAGFRIERLAEPRPEAAVCRDNPWLERWRRHAPLVLFVAATK